MDLELLPGSGSGKFKAGPGSGINHSGSTTLVFKRGMSPDCPLIPVGSCIANSLAERIQVETGFTIGVIDKVEHTSTFLIPFVRGVYRIFSEGVGG